MTANERCECGVLLSEHPPLPKPGPLRSWKGQRGYVPPLRPGKAKPISITRRPKEIR